MKQSTRAERRDIKSHQKRRIKARRLLDESGASARLIGKESRTQTICSCWMCSHDHKPAFEKSHPTKLFA